MKPADVLDYFTARRDETITMIREIVEIESPSCDVEIGSITGRALVEREAANASASLVFEPSAAGRVKTGRKGTGMFTIKAHGIPAHAGLEPEKGASSILEIARQIEKLHTLNN